MPTYTCPECGAEQGATTTKPRRDSAHHCPDCGAVVADSQQDIDWTDA